MPSDNSRDLLFASSEVMEWMVHEVQRRVPEAGLAQAREEFFLRRGKHACSNAVYQEWM